MISRLQKTTLVFWVLLALASLAGGFLVYYTTAVAPWAFSDSTVYIAAGVNWIKGNGMGFTQADGSYAHLLHFPPGYPVLLGLGSVLADPISVARWIDIASFALLIFLGGLLILKITGSKLLPLLFGALLIFSPFLLPQFSGVMSEPAAILAGTLSLLLLVRFAAGGKKNALVAAALLSAAALFIRYQQAALLLAGGVFLLAFSRGNWQTRFKDLLLYAALSAGPFAAWLIVDSLSAGGGARVLALRGDLVSLTQGFLARVYDTVKYWFPWRSNLLAGVNANLMRLLLMGLFAGFLVAAWLHARKTRSRSPGIGPVTLLVALCGIYILADLVFLWAATLVAEPPPDIDNRMLSSLLPVLFLLVLGLEHLAGHAWQRRWWVNGVLLATAALFCVVFAPEVKRFAVDMHGYGNGYTSLAFKENGLVAGIKAIPAETPLVSNSPALIQFFTLREPYRAFDAPDDPNIGLTQNFGDLDTPAQSAFRQRCGALVIFDPDKIAPYDHEAQLYFPPSAYGVIAALQPAFSNALGSIYYFPGCQP